MLVLFEVKAQHGIPCHGDKCKTDVEITNFSFVERTRCEQIGKSFDDIAAAIFEVHQIPVLHASRHLHHVRGEFHAEACCCNKLRGVHNARRENVPDSEHHCNKLVVHRAVQQECFLHELVRQRVDL